MKSYAILLKEISLQCIQIREDTNKGEACLTHHFPIQNLLKIFFNKSSLLISPVISPK
jgi:hypothetical protein